MRTTQAAGAQHAVDLGEQPVLVGDVVRELLHERHAERRVGERQERRVADDPLARTHARMLVQAAEPERVGLEVDHPRVVARLGEQPAAPARAAADVDEPVAGRRGAELLDEVDDVDEPRRADRAGTRCPGRCSRACPARRAPPPSSARSSRSRARRSPCRRGRRGRGTAGLRRATRGRRHAAAGARASAGSAAWRPWWPATRSRACPTGSRSRQPRKRSEPGVSPSASYSSPTGPS